MVSLYPRIRHVRGDAIQPGFQWSLRVDSICKAVKTEKYVLQQVGCCLWIVADPQCSAINQVAMTGVNFIARIKSWSLRFADILVMTKFLF
jgi:hypothetical protein